MGETSVKHDNRINTGKDKYGICRLRISSGLPCRGCIYYCSCERDRKAKIWQEHKKTNKKTIKNKTKPKTIIHEENKVGNRYMFTEDEKREIMHADRQGITEIAERIGKPRNYILNLRARWWRKKTK